MANKDYGFVVVANNGEWDYFSAIDGSMENIQRIIKLNGRQYQILVDMNEGSYEGYSNSDILQLIMENRTKELADFGETAMEQISNMEFREWEKQFIDTVYQNEEFTDEQYFYIAIFIGLNNGLNV